MSSGVPEESLTNTSSSLPQLAGSTNLHTPITLFVSPATNLEGLVNEWRGSTDLTQAGGDGDAEAAPPRLMLTGLHTCGDLSPAVLRLTTATDSCAVACHVGCCYNLITERYLRSSYNSPEGWLCLLKY